LARSGKAAFNAAARSAWLGPWIRVAAPIFSIIATCSSSDSRPFSGVRTSPALAQRNRRASSGGVVDQEGDRTALA